MRGVYLLPVAAALTAILGCHLPRSRAPQNPTQPVHVPYSQYHLEGFSWNAVDRVLVLPFLNESAYTRADEEVGRALTAQLQQLGRFEVVAAPPDELARLAREVHRAGSFNEAVLLDLAMQTRADVIVHGIVTHYSPYPRPRLGLILQAIGPRQAKVVASVDGLWDTTQLGIAERVRAYYRQKPQRHPWIRNHVIANDDSFAGELALDSPALFQRYVCNEAAVILTQERPVPAPAVPNGAQPSTAVTTPAPQSPNKPDTPAS